MDHRKESILLWAAAGLVIVLYFGLLVYNANTLNMWDDEINCLYLTKEPAGKLISLMANNIHEDPPFYNLMLHFWIRLVGTGQFELRLLSIIFWGMALPGIFFSVKEITGEKRIALVSVLVSCLLPYHWLYPVATRWYSLAGLLLIWHFYFFSVILKSYCPASANRVDHDQESQAASPAWLPSIGYTLTGAILWYTTYLAPVVFGAALIVWLFVSRKKRLITILILNWLSILVIYIPWLPTLYRQIPLSVGRASFMRNLVELGMSIFALALGESAVPWQLHIMIPGLLGFSLLLVIVIRNHRKVLIPLIYLLIIGFSMVLTSTIWTKYLILLSILWSLVIAISIVNEFNRNRLLAMTGIILILLAWSGSALNMINRQNWISWRWLDDYHGVVQDIREEYPQALVVTNSNSALYYLGSPVDKRTIIDWIEEDNEKDIQQLIVGERCIWYEVLSSEDEALDLRTEIGQFRNIVYLHGGYTSEIGSFDKVEEARDILSGMGYSEIKQMNFQEDETNRWKAMLFSGYEIPPYRVSVYYFEKTDAD